MGKVVCWPSSFCWSNCPPPIPHLDYNMSNDLLDKGPIRTNHGLPNKALLIDVLRYRWRPSFI